MGVLNVTPDSFSDGGRFLDPDAAVARGERLFAEGADIIDIGGESTRPFSEPVSPEEESRRVVPVIERLAPRVSVPISIDTTKADVARRAVDAGAAIINDVSALRFDPAMPALAARHELPVVLMHMLGNPKNMQVAPAYDDVVESVFGFLEARLRAAAAGGLAAAKLIVDPGIGFGKTREHNLQLLRRLDRLAELGVPLLVGTSRKAFIRRTLAGERQEDIAADLPEVETGTQATVAAAVLNGAHIVRVHDVHTTAVTVKILDAILDS
jgi:dihydropteroate synthase